MEGIDPPTSNSPDDLVLIAERRRRQQAAYRAVAARHPGTSLFEAAARFEITLIHLADPTTPCPAEMVSQQTGPVLVLVGDDASWAQQSVGPNGWPCASVLLDWTLGVVVGGSGSDPGHYIRALILARSLQRAVLIETTAAMAPRWDAFFRPHPIIEYRLLQGVRVVPTLVQQ